jgi:hypothetical protein
VSGEMIKETETMSMQEISPRPLSPYRAALIGTLAVLAAWLLPAAVASAAAPAWKVTVASNPTNFTPGSVPAGLKTKFLKFPQYSIVATNIGSAITSGPATITDTLPIGVTPVETYGVSFSKNPAGAYVEKELSCKVEGQTVTCEGIEAVGQGGYVHLAIGVKVAGEGEAPPSVFNEVSISGGGAGEAVASTTTTISKSIASFGFTSGSAALSFAASGSDGSPVTQAGSHPDQLTIDTGFPTQLHGVASAAPAGHLRDLRINLPRGVVVNPRATPIRCREIQLQTENCPDASAIGTLTVQAIFGFGPAPGGFPLYNMVPPAGTAGELGAVIIGGIFIHVIGGVHSAGEYELGAGSSDVLASGNPIIGAQTVLWGEPSDSSHDGLRGVCNILAQASLCPVERTNAPLLTMPSSCRPSLTATAIADSWEDPSQELERSAEVEDPSTELPTGVDGCSQLKFNPTMEAQPTTNLSDSPTGLNVNFHVPQTNDFESLATANFKDVKVVLPPGISINPSSANGLDACSSAQIGLTTPVGQTPPHFTETPAACPDAAKVGTVEVSTPPLDHPLNGAIYAAKPYDNPFSSLLAVYIAVYDEATGVVAKLAGKVETDPVTGQITGIFNQNPELPIEDVRTSFFGGPRAPLKTPLACGNHAIGAEIVPWSTPEGATVNLSDSFATSVAAAGSGPCPASEAAAPNSLSFDAGTLNPQAGAYSPFVLKLSRQDGTQRLAGIDTTLPEGLLAKLAGTTYCSEAQIAQAKSREAPNLGAAERQSPSCPLSSEVGTVTVGVGAGIAPYYATGHAYLAGPYKGAPLSLVVISPAVAGPYDLGAVVARVALYVNSETAQAHAVSDPLPTILQGVPLDVRSIALKMDRPNFTLNPTSCDPMAITGSALMATGQSAALTSPFQVGGCSALKFGPKLSIRLKGGTKRTKHPALRAVVTYPKGSYANLAKAQVTLPHSAFLDTTHIGTICTRVQFAADTCPAASIYGFAKATTPLLDNPVEGPVYLRSSSHKLPDLVLALHGQIDADAVARVDTGKGDGIRTTFEAVPDVPLTKVVLEMKGGKKGLLINSENICSKPQKAIADFTAQNGKIFDTTPLIANDCPKKAKKQKKKARQR